MRLRVDLKTALIVSAVLIASMNSGNRELLVITAAITALFIASTYLVKRLIA